MGLGHPQPGGHGFDGPQKRVAPRRGRRRIAEAAGCDPEEIAITRNASEALENAQCGMVDEEYRGLRVTPNIYTRLSDLD